MPTNKGIFKIRRKAPWTTAELKQLGRTPDSVLARRFRRTIREVLAKREARRIGLPIRRRTWTPAEIRLLGTMPDQELAERLRRSYHLVWYQRKMLGIPPFQSSPTRRQNGRKRKLKTASAYFGKKTRPWTAAEEKLLGTMADADLAWKLKRPSPEVFFRRHILKIPSFQKRASARSWTPREIKLLGRFTDAEVARRLGCSPFTVQHRRVKLGIPAYHPYWPRRTRPKTTTR